ncbi:uncharacterized protein KY384_008018 [Bacidia gigantensis]|uniref:uncharacterized protein n=1 Tax=Bacidia gigantensis TaxID=2732470 RepID=UPI001D04A6C9|nr:uncharacterized protein KY384_008018 [Bacidia gigantensis]KAG8527274.1 hypothetical protein KY384_008018 [Bacidia gigantensis]
MPRVAFDFYTDADGRTPFFNWFPPYTHIYTGKASSTSLQFALEALQKCTACHQCFVPHEKRLPKRLINIEIPGLKSDGVRVIDTTAALLPPSTHYAALSYCWGPESTIRSQMVCMTKENLADMAAGTDLSRLPAVFKDAVLTSRILGLRYLWIDALCIAQGDRQEWLEESVKMAEVYSCAFVTIAASASASCHESFLNVNHLRSFREAVEAPGSEALSLGVKVYVRLSTSNLYGEATLPGLPSLTTMIDHRAWCYQEMVLSPRILHFTHTQVVLSCLEGVESEDSDRINDQYLTNLQPRVYQWRTKILSKTLLTSQEASLVWKDVLESYIDSRIASAEDRLTAVAGVASQLHAHMQPGNTYLAGLWKDTFVQELLWSVNYWPSGGHRRQKAPTWSWASLSVGSSEKGSSFLRFYRPEDSGEVTLHTRLVRAEMKEEGGGTFGQVKHGTVVLEGVDEKEATTRSNIAWEAVDLLLLRTHTTQSAIKADFLVLGPAGETGEQYQRLGICKVKKDFLILNQMALHTL